MTAPDRAPEWRDLRSDLTPEQRAIAMREYAIRECGVTYTPESAPHTHGGTDAPECTTCIDVRLGDALIEKAAQALIDSPDPTRTWVSMDEDQRDHWRADARAVLDTVAPDIYAEGYSQALMDAAITHGPPPGTERLLWVMAVRATEECPYGGEGE